MISEIDRRLSSAPASVRVSDEWAATFILLGLRYPREIGEQLLRGVRSMRESTTYQAILEEGEATGIAKGVKQGQLEEARALILRLGQRRLGAPPANLVALLEQVSELPVLEAAADQVIDGAAWDEILKSLSRSKV